MRRFIRTKVLHTTHRRNCSGDSLLEEIFSELSACDITHRPSQHSTQPEFTIKGGHGASTTVKQVEKGFSAAPIETSTSEEMDIRTELSKQEQLQHMLQEARGQAALARSEGAKMVEAQRHSRYVASPPAALNLSSAELIQERSPQHFTPAKDSSRLLALPRVKSPGTVAVVTLVGKVLLAATMHGDDNSEETGDTLMAEDGPHARLLVQYTVPFLPSSGPISIQVRCYGATLASFAREYVKVGDLIHVLGHIMPLEVNSPDDPVFCVCALPVGGNISVVLAADHTSAS
ncbi:hypothetical protein ERJ75_000716900 [Trypanosoma vivax]|nr:hypothetical protein TRVL_09093 [Trypanosoma vivax]KAH8613642.1 hypothetical protein ERJ75_000716900 [Trypanosoma vivax]